MLHLFPSTRAARRRERRAIRWFFVVMGLVTVLFAGALVARVRLGW